VLRSAHTAIAAADAVLASGDVAYALCRPSGHHAHRDRAGGFCYVNNSAIAAQRLRQRHDRIAVLDVDAHHGDGTQNVFYARTTCSRVDSRRPERLLPVLYRLCARARCRRRRSFNLNLPLPHGSGNEAFLHAVDQGVAAIRDFGAQALVLPLASTATRTIPSACSSSTSTPTVTSASASAR
jgi:acetoin utilization deacetylase AcuC-like enzyme